MSFSEFSKNYNHQQKSEEKLNNKKDEIHNLKQKEDEIMDQYNCLKDKSEPELMQELFKQVNHQKQNGTFDFKALENGISALEGYLTPEQQKKINNLLSQIK